MGENRDDLEREIAALIAENITIAYVLGPGGLVDPDTIRVAGTDGVAVVVAHRLLGPHP